MRRFIFLVGTTVFSRLKINVWIQAHWDKVKRPTPQKPSSVSFYLHVFESLVRLNPKRMTKKEETGSSQQVLHSSSDTPCWTESDPAMLKLEFLSYIKFIILHSNSCTNIKTHREV